MPEKNPGEALNRLLRTMAHLRSPAGCPWDAEQTPESLRPYLIEETYEVLDAIDNGNPREICQELGDLLLQIVFHSQIFEERGSFAFAQVADSITDKLIRRHPHVFSDQTINSQADLDRQWEQIKANERSGQASACHFLSGIPLHLPALQRAQKIIQKSSRNSLSLSVLGLQEKQVQSLEEICLSQGDKDNHDREAMIANLLLTVVELARRWDIDAENSLRLLNQRMIKELTSPISQAQPFKPHDQKNTENDLDV